jgi:hypothetical protein
MYYSKGNSQDKNPNARLLCTVRTGSLLGYGASRAHFRERDIRERDIGERDIGERDIGERDIGERDIWERDIGERDTGERDIGAGTSGGWTVGRLSTHVDSPSSCCSTSTSKMLLAALASRRVGAAGRGFCCVTSPQNSSPLRV